MRELAQRRCLLFGLGEGGMSRSLVTLGRQVAALCCSLRRAFCWCPGGVFWSAGVPGGGGRTRPKNDPPPCFWGWCRPAHSSRQVVDTHNTYAIIRGRIGRFPLDIGELQ